VDINKQFGGQLKDFLKVLREKGECKIQFNIPHEVQEACNLKEKKIEFKTHKQLDEFLKTVDEHYPSFKSDFKDDFQLLKSFDRAFWLRHFRNPETQDYQPLTGEIKGICECPFGDPISTNSYGGKVIKNNSLNFRIGFQWINKLKENGQTKSNKKNKNFPPIKSKLKNEFERCIRKEANFFQNN
jgi:hypothetical protein